MNVFERCDRAANSCYNRGLRLAKQRDLSGAVPYLKRALELNKNLIEARNLLGLIFDEIERTRNEEDLILPLLRPCAPVGRCDALTAP